MTGFSVQDILSVVEHPSRYLGTETNCISKDPTQVKLRFALVFPDLYEIGMSNFGMQILYHVLNDQAHIAAERVFAPPADMEAALRARGRSLFSLESKTPLRSFDVIGFSLLYELNYTNILTILDLARISPRRRQRGEADPLIIAGGASMCNPEPVAALFDAIVVGEAETAVVQLAEAWIRWSETGARRKSRLLERLAGIEGVYVPRFYKAIYNGRGLQTIEAQGPASSRVRRAIVPELNDAAFPEKPIVPYGKPIHDRLRLEIARGCTRGCRFCQAGMIYRPVRERSQAMIVRQSQRALCATGYEDVSLLSLSTGDYSALEGLLEQLINLCEARKIAVSLPSMRAGTLSARAMETIKRIRKTGFTIAPEAGSLRLRRVINKNLSDAQIFETVGNAFEMGWQVIKLYFMIGLPTEQGEDLEQIVSLVRRLRKLGGRRGRRSKINVSVATFIPKAHTPFQWEPQISLEEAEAKIEWLRGRLKLPGIRFKWQNPRVSYLEGLWSRGDRRLAELLIKAHANGCRFDGWSDGFNFERWRRSWEACHIDPEAYVTRRRSLSEPLPWDHIDSGVAKDFLLLERTKAFDEQPTADCRHGDCQGCGLCDFTKIYPRIGIGGEGRQKGGSDGGEKAADGYKKIEISYAKKDEGRFLGHLELVNIMVRALRRAGVPLKFSEGFHPKPKVSFDNPLPLGMESEREIFWASVGEKVCCEELEKVLQKQLPPGLSLLGCREVSAKRHRAAEKQVAYRVLLTSGRFEAARLEDFFGREAFWISRRRSREKDERLDIKSMVRAIEMPAEDRLRLTLKIENGRHIRPGEVIENIFRLSREQVLGARITKIDAAGVKHTRRAGADGRIGV